MLVIALFNDTDVSKNSLT